MTLKIRVLSACLAFSLCAEQLCHASPLPQPADLFEKPAVHLKLPLSIASVEEAFYAPGSDRLIYLIQDAHTNESGQLNLAKTLDILLSAEGQIRRGSDGGKEEKGLKYVFAEAAVGDNSLSFLRERMDLKTREKTAGSYIKKGLLHGAEYLDLTSNRDFKIWGVENIDLYFKSLEAYRRVAVEREKFQAYLKKGEQTVRALKPLVFNPSLLAFDETRSKFLDEKISLTEYFETLSRSAEAKGINLLSYPHLRALKELREREGRIDFQKAGEEQRRAFASLSALERVALADFEKEKNPFRINGGDHAERKGFMRFLKKK